MLLSTIFYIFFVKILHIKYLLLQFRFFYIICDNIYQNKKGGLFMKAILKKFISNANIKMLSSFATFALVITTVASNQRCWYVLHEEKLPENAKKLRKF